VPPAAPGTAPPDIETHCGRDGYAWSLQDHAWRIVAKLNWPDTYQAEYIALTRLQADALANADRKLAAAARAFVEIVSPADILPP
jgi:hypothetical protein